MQVQEIKEENQRRILWDLKENQKKVSFWPKDMDIEITSYCNYRCRMCPHALSENQAAHHLDPSVWEKLKKLLPYCKRVMLQGDGEPLLYPHFREIVQELAAHEIQICTTTNLSLLTEELAKFMAGYFALLTVSCDGGDRETYEAIRVNGKFGVFQRNLKLLMKYADPEKVVVNAVVMRQNLCGLITLLRFLKECGVHRVIFSSLLTTELLKNERDNPMCYPHIASQKLREAADFAAENHMELTINWDYGVPRDDCAQAAEWELFRQAEAEAGECVLGDEDRERFLEAYRELHQVERVRRISSGTYHCEGVCKNLFEKIYVDTCGNLTLCCFGKTKCVGNILEDSLEDIWNGEVYQDCRAAFFEGNLPDFCIGCRYAMASSSNRLQAYPFRVTDMDSRFFEDDFFWENR